MSSKRGTTCNFKCSGTKAIVKEFQIKQSLL